MESHDILQVYIVLPSAAAALPVLQLPREPVDDHNVQYKPVTREREEQEAVSIGVCSTFILRRLQDRWPFVCTVNLPRGRMWRVHSKDACV